MTLKETNLPLSNEVRYLGIHLDKRLAWGTRIKKSIMLNNRYGLLDYFLNKIETTYTNNFVQ